MLKTKLETLLLLWICSELCVAIKVPVVWNSESEVRSGGDEDFSVQQFQPQQVNTFNDAPKPIPAEYFQYTAKKPQFAVDIAEFHGVQAPENHYSSYPIRPYTGVQKPDLGKHHMFDKGNQVYEHLQKYKEQENSQNKAIPHESSYEVYHPYEREVVALQSIYKDPVLDKIRYDLEHTKDRLQNYEKNAGKANISKDEYLEDPEVTDRKKFPHKNIPATFEIHRPLRRPVYYRPSQFHGRHNVNLNKKFRHPLNQNYVKIKPIHYRPLYGHLQSLQQIQASKYDDEHNEYPQVVPLQNFAEPSEGYDIYEKGKSNYERLRDNVDESLNKVVKENHPQRFERLELQNYENDKSEEDEHSQEEFIPVKSYAQVRKTETAKYLPKEAALREATNFEELQNAPRLKQAVKSTKAQTVYSEEGYEDSAYDHAGEQKHASDHEGHGGYLVEKELSGGKYKIPSENAAHEDSGGSIQGDKILHGEKWKNKDKDHDKETEAEDYAEDEHEKLIDADIYQDSDSDPDDNDDDSDREKRANGNETTTIEHDVNKREVKFKVPELNLNDTFLKENQYQKLSKKKSTENLNNDDIKVKYPYYFKDLDKINMDSPLRYAENLKFMPRKSKGGTEFYDSRSNFECPEVDDDIDPIPDKIKNGEIQTEDSKENDKSDEENISDKRKKRQANFEQMKTQRLKGLGDKIDCFKAKYFGSNPLDSPFFKEELISKPEPLIIPNFPSYKFNNDFYSKKVTEIKNKLNEGSLPSLILATNQNNSSGQENISTDFTEVLTNKNHTDLNDIISVNLLGSKPQNTSDDKNITYVAFHNQEDVTQSPPTVRRKRSFTYEPYKIIRDSKNEESKKSTVISHVSPLMKELKTRKLVDKVNFKINEEKEQPVKRNAAPRFYINIDKKDRSKNKSENYESTTQSSLDFVDVNVDSRRGEPRYEMKNHNHKIRYTPVENKKAMTIEDYKASTQTKDNNNINFVKEPVEHRHLISRQMSRNPTWKRNFSHDSLSPTLDVQTTSASNIQINRVKNLTTDPKPTTTTRDSAKESRKSDVSQEKESEEKSSEEDYQEYEDDSEEITTTTERIVPKQKIQKSGRRAKVIPKLKLVTRFHITPSKKEEEPELIENDAKTDSPKYREKTKKSSKSTIVTDSNSYGDGEDDMRKDEIDAMIGVTQNMDDYTPLYEKEIKNKRARKFRSSEESNESNENIESKEKENSKEEKSDEYEYYEDSNESTEDESVENAKLQNKNRSGNKNDKSNESHNEEKDQTKEESSITATPTPKTLKRLNTRTTTSPTPTTEVRSMIKMRRPIISKKKIEIHKESPYDKKSPHITQFREDIKEVEVVKEYPEESQKPIIDLTQNKNLAKEVNMLSDVEIFKENLDIVTGPKHGGNYKSLRNVNRNGDAMPQTPKLDAKTSENKNTQRRIHYVNDQFIESQPNQRVRKTPLKNTFNRIFTKKNGELSDLLEAEVKQKLDRPMHGGNYKDIKTLARQNDDKNEDSMITETEEAIPEPNIGTLKQERDLEEEMYDNTDLARLKAKNEKTRDSTDSAAELLNAFIEAAPLLTTTPAYILDPSKRRYYYVDP